MEAPKLEIEERRTPSKRARTEIPLARSVARRTRSKIEHDFGKRDTSKSSVIELHDSPIRDTTSALEVIEPPLVSTTEVVPFLSPNFKARTYRRKTTAYRAKAISLDVKGSSGKVNS